MAHHLDAHNLHVDGTADVLVGLPIVWGQLLAGNGVEQRRDGDAGESGRLHDGRGWW